MHRRQFTTLAALAAACTASTFEVRAGFLVPRKRLRCYIGPCASTRDAAMARDVYENFISKGKSVGIVGDIWSLHSNSDGWLLIHTAGLAGKNLDSSGNYMGREIERDREGLALGRKSAASAGPHMRKHVLRELGYQEVGRDELKKSVDAIIIPSFNGHNGHKGQLYAEHAKAVLDNSQAEAVYFASEALNKPGYPNLFVDPFPECDREVHELFENRDSIECRITSRLSAGMECLRL